jgi:hypothetical protein
MSTSGRIHGDLLRLIFFLSNKQAEDYFAALGYQPHRREFCHRRDVFFHQNRGTIGMAGAQANGYQWTVNSTTWNHLQTMWQAPPLDLLRLIYEETHHQNIFEASGYRSPT